MDNRQIKQLVSELRALRIRELEVLDTIDLALPSIGTQPNCNTTDIFVGNDNHSTVSNRQDNIDNADQAEASYSVGDCIEITNKVRKLFNRTPTRRDRIGTVMKVSEKKVEFVTDNGTNAWRAPHNLKKLKE
jgi:Nitrile hydratase beta subunit